MKFKTVHDTTFSEAKFPDSVDDKSTEQLLDWVNEVFEFPKNPTINLDIRLGEDRAFSGWIIRIIDSATVYKAYYFTYQLDPNYSSRIQTMRFQKVSLGPPKAGWDEFFKQLGKYQLEQIKDYHLIKGYSGGADGSTGTLEIFKFGSHINAKLPNVIISKEQFPDVKQFFKAVNFIDKQFDLNVSFE